MHLTCTKICVSYFELGKMEDEMINNWIRNQVLKSIIQIVNKRLRK